MSRFVILMYHMIREPENRREARYACPPGRFRRHLAWLRRNRPLISLAEVEAALAGEKTIPEGAVAVTLDDGHGDNYTHAFPIARELEIPLTIFLTTGYLGKTNAWMEHFPQHPMLDWEQIREMHRHGVRFGAHTVTHPKLPTLPPDQAVEEIRVGKAQIEEHLGCECRHFAYPYGLLDERTREQVAGAGFRLACSTRSGFNHLGRDPLVLHRIEVCGTDPLWKLRQKLVFGSNEAGLTLPLRYYAARLRERLGG